MKKIENPKSTIVEYTNVSELDDYFKESNLQVYDTFINSIDLAIDKKSITAIPFIVKRLNSNVSCILSLEKKKWLSVLETIQKKFIDEEHYEYLNKINIVLTKLKNPTNEIKNLLPSKNSDVNRRRQREGEKSSRTLSSESFFDSGSRNEN